MNHSASDSRIVYLTLSQVKLKILFVLSMAASLSEPGVHHDKKPHLDPEHDVGCGDSDLIPGGHVEELRRDFSIWSLGSLCLCLMGTWEALSSVVAAALTNGGAPCLFYN